MTFSLYSVTGRHTRNIYSHSSKNVFWMSFGRVCARCAVTCQQQHCVFIMKERVEILTEIHIRACLDWRARARLTSLRGCLSVCVCVCVCKCVSVCIYVWVDCCPCPSEGHMRSRIGFLTANPCRHGPSSKRRLEGVIVFRTATDSRRPYLAAVHANTCTHKNHI